MTKEEIVERLLQTSFVCLDDDKEERELWEGNVGIMYSLLIESINKEKQSFVSFEAKKAVDKFTFTPSYDNFHYAAHHLILSLIIGRIAIGEKFASDAIEEVAQCGQFDKKLKRRLEIYAIYGNEK